jgi:hypothetical protein
MTPSAGSTSPEGGVAALPAKAVAEKAEAVLRAAKSVRLRGTMTADGDSTSFDLAYASGGTTGSVTVGGAPVRLLMVGTTIYVQPSAQFWKRQAGARAAKIIKLTRGKWIETSAQDQRFAKFASLGKRNEFVDQLFADLPANLRKVSTRKIDGIGCVGLAQSDGIMWVDAATARPVRIEPIGSAEKAGRIQFSEYDAVRQPLRPPASAVIDARTLES